MNKRSVIFDFDRTLFNNKKFFEEDLPELLGIKSEIFLKTIEDNFKDSETGNINYNLDKHLEILKSMGILNISIEKAKEIIDGLFEKADEYLLPGAKELLQNFKERGDEMHLATLGNPKWQERKIDSIKLLKVYFDDKHKIFAEKNKAEVVKSLKIIDEEIIIINDKPEEALAIEEAIGRKCRIYIIRSKYSEAAKYEGKIYENLEEIMIDIFPEQTKEIREELAEEFKLSNR